MMVKKQFFLTNDLRNWHLFCHCLSSKMMRWGSVALTQIIFTNLDLQEVFPPASPKRMQIPPGSQVISASIHGCLGGPRMSLGVCAEATETHFSHL